MILRADHPTFDGLIVPGSPLKTAGVGGAPKTRAPDLGEHTGAVFERLLGYDAAKLADLRERKII
jgi:crotonobetainyl-CoA:carnitine CoA-transferase CaiB-like acyl-CoA transferase